MENNQNGTYIQLLVNTLKNKITVLKQLEQITIRQAELLEDEKAAPDVFDATLKEKDEQISVLNHLDTGFEKIYERVKDELQGKKQTYKTEILQLQGMIGEITDLSVKIQALEKRNKDNLQRYLASQRNQIKQFKVSSQTVSSYYKSMVNTHQGQSYFMDKKK